MCCVSNIQAGDDAKCNFAFGSCLATEVLDDLFGVLCIT